MTVTDEDPGYSRRFKEGFHTDLMCRQKKTEINGILHVATALDPRFKSLKCLPREKQSTVWNLVENLIKDDTESDPIPELSAKVSKMFCFNSDSDEGEECGRPEYGQGGEYEYELRLYKAIPAEPDTSKCPLEFWKANRASYPRLSKLAKNYLCIPSTSVPVEPLFSAPGELVSKKRNCLKPDIVNMLLSLSCWLKDS